MTELPLLTSRRLMLEVALYLEGSGDDINDLCERNQITPEDLQTLIETPIFRDDLAKVRTEVREHGLTFRVKARTMAEELLKTTWMITQDGATSPSVKADLIKAVVEWGGLKPQSKNSEQQGAGGVQILINLGETHASYPQVQTIDASSEQIPESSEAD